MRTGYNVGRERRRKMGNGQNKKGRYLPSPISPARFPTKTNERSCCKVRFKQRFTSGKIEDLTPEKAVACIDTRHLHTHSDVGSFESSPFRIPGQTETRLSEHCPSCLPIGIAFWKCSKVRRKRINLGGGFFLFGDLRLFSSSFLLLLLLFHSH